MHISSQQNKEIIELCHRYPVDRFYFFGSVLTDHFSKDSDVDTQVFFENSVTGKQIWDFWNELEEILGRKVDLVSVPILNPYFKKEVELTRHLVYEQQREEVFI